MRQVRLSKDYQEALHALLAFGEQRFGSRVVDQKRARLSQIISDVLAVNPGVGSFDEELGIYYLAVSRTPFTLLYDFDDTELRMHLIIHQRAVRAHIDLSVVEW